MIRSMAISGTDWLEVPTIYKAYVKEHPHKIWAYMVQYLHLRILEFPLIRDPFQLIMQKHGHGY